MKPVGNASKSMLDHALIKPRLMDAVHKRRLESLSSTNIEYRLERE